MKRSVLIKYKPKRQGKMAELSINFKFYNYEDKQKFIRKKNQLKRLPN